VAGIVLGVISQRIAPRNREIIRLDKGSDLWLSDSEAALRVAFELLRHRFGREAIDHQKPYRITLTNGSWLVETTFPPRMKCRNLVIRLDPTTATVLSIYH
jgi:hypothetical protein